MLRRIFSNESDSMDINLVNGSDDVDDVSDIEDVNNLHEENEASVDEAQNIQQSSNYNVGDFVIVKFEDKKIAGLITSIFDKSATVDCMEKLSKQWRWPAK